MTSKTDPLKTSRRTLLLGAASAVGMATVLGKVQANRNAGAQIIVPAGKATWISTTKTRPWQLRPLRTPGFHWDTHDIRVGLDRTLQVIEGFGACFSELGWTSLQALRTSDQESIFQELFSPGVGANFNLCRMPIGANDFSRAWYSYAETPNDFALDHFTIANDLQTLVPFIKAAQRHNPALALWASPWSPPSWMKQNDFYAEAVPSPSQPPNGIRPEQVAREGSDMFIQEERYYRAYANYFGRFIDAYRQQGIAVGMVMPQNEFNSAQPFPSCTWTPVGLGRFIQHLGPVMQERGVEVFFGTLERGNPKLLDAVLKNQQARQHISGVGVQWDGKGALSSIHQEHPELKIYQSEQECGDGKNDWRACVHCWNLMKTYFDHGTNAYMYWNLSLPQGGESHWGWRQNSLVTVDSATQTFQFNHEYYLLKHLSHFVRSGARRIETHGLLSDAIAFLNPDGGVTVMLRNSTPFRRPIDIAIAHRRVEGWMEPDSFNTLYLPAEL